MYGGLLEISFWSIDGKSNERLAFVPASGAFVAKPKSPTLRATRQRLFSTMTILVIFSQHLVLCVDEDQPACCLRDWTPTKAIPPGSCTAWVEPIRREDPLKGSSLSTLVDRWEENPRE